MRAKLLFAVVLSTSFLITSASVHGAALGTAFTYQGQLKQSGSPFNGTADFQFSLWDSAGSGSPPTGGAQIGSTIFFDAGHVAPVTVTGGLFAVQLDFGGSAFLGNARWLQVAVRSPAGSGSYTTLAPRESLTATPYALQTRGIVVDASNNVGIGTASPVKKLQVGDWNITGSEGMIHFGSRSSNGDFNRREWNIGVPQTIDDLSGEGYSFVIRDADQNSVAPEFMVHYGNGYVGIGVIPSFKLDVAAVASDGVAIHGDNNGNGYGVWGTAGSGGTGVVGGASGNGGSGVFGSADGAGSIGVHGKGGNFGTNSLLGDGVYGEASSGIGVHGHSSTSYGVYGVTGATTLNTAGVYGEANGNGQVIGVYGNASTGVNAAGVVGIGATGGYFRSNGLGGNTALYADGLAVVKVIRILGADLTESFEVSGDDPKPGDVVVIDSERPGELKLCAGPYDPKVAGVISGAGGIRTAVVMGQPGSIADGKHPVALTGRVYCRCDASLAPIACGDLLTTSATPGHAMKATDREKSFGAVIGKAMTKLDKGQGLVLVLVTLQ